MYDFGEEQSILLPPFHGRAKSSGANLFGQVDSEQTTRKIDLT